MTFHRGQLPNTETDVPMPPVKTPIVEWETRVDNGLCAIAEELVRARRENPEPLNSAHEGYSVILEELDELKAEVWRKARDRDYGAMGKEAIQVAAMGLRFYLEVVEPALVKRESTWSDEELARGVVISWSPKRNWWKRLKEIMWDTEDLPGQGHQPQGPPLDASNPPRGGSGVPR